MTLAVDLTLNTEKQSKKKQNYLLPAKAKWGRFIYITVERSIDTIVLKYSIIQSDI